LCTLLALTGAGFFGPGPDDDDDDDDDDAPRMHRAAAPSYDFEADFVDAEMIAPAAPAPADIGIDGDMAETLGATPGGAQDVNLVRALIEAGTIPRPEQITPEGLFSEHDLPLNAGATCDQLLCVHAEVTDAGLITEPDLHYLAQLGFSSSLAASGLQRPPLNLVFVVDTSDSMAGRPLEVVRESMFAVLGQLGPGDQVSIVRFDRTATRALPPTAVGESAIASAIATLSPNGISHLDAGMWAGVNLARVSGRGFDGSTRIMLFTDDRPTFGRDRPAAFVDAARVAAADGIGVTTVGVGTRFDAALAREVASVRGGNLMFFDDLERMRSTFEADFDTMVTELAHGLELVVDPAAGMRVTEVYGLPASAVQRRGDGIALSVETLFASKKKGAIYFGLSPVGRPNLPRVPARAGMLLGEVRLSYQEVGPESNGQARFSRAALTTLRRSRVSPGLRRGRLLVDEAIALRRAGTLVHDEGKREQALSLVRDLHARLLATDDTELAEQRELVGRLIGLLGG
jgi:Ca-activated chloride channel family protein